MKACEIEPELMNTARQEKADTELPPMPWPTTPPRIEIDAIGGACPFQAEGTIDNATFYLRARGSKWSIEITEPDAEPWFYSRHYGPGPVPAT